MKYQSSLLYLVTLFLFACLPNVFCKTVNILNKIEGQVYDQNRVPVSDMYVELLNDVESLIARTKTSSTGRFSFSGVSSGRFKVRVLSSGKNFLQQTQDVDVVNLRSTSSDIVFVEFYLRFDKSASEALQKNLPDAIFVQEAPQNAKRFYEEGVAKADKNQDQAILDLEQAIKIFPDYFVALDLLGKIYNLRKDYNNAYPYLLKAVELNKRSVSSYYSLSYAFYRLEKNSLALEAAKKAVIINAGLADVQLLYGILLKINGNFQESEKALLKVKSLSKKPNAETHWQLALLYNKMSRNKDAAKELETFLKLSPDSPDTKKIQDLIIRLNNPPQK